MEIITAGRRIPRSNRMCLQVIQKKVKITAVFEKIITKIPINLY